MLLCSEERNSFGLSTLFATEEDGETRFGTTSLLLHSTAFVLFFYAVSLFGSRASPASFMR